MKNRALNVVLYILAYIFGRIIPILGLMAIIGGILYIECRTLYLMYQVSFTEYSLGGIDAVVIVIGTSIMIIELLIASNLGDKYIRRKKAEQIKYLEDNFDWDKDVQG